MDESKKEIEKTEIIPEVEVKEAKEEPEVKAEREGKRIITEAMSIFAQQKNYPPFLDKIDTQQISEIIKSHDDSDKREYRDKELKRRYAIVFVILALLLVVFFTLSLATKDPELYREIVKLLLAFGIGMAGGYGIGKSRSKD